jgi:hypothetical protein
MIGWHRFNEEHDVGQLSELPVRQSRLKVWKELQSLLPDLPPRQVDIARLTYYGGMSQDAVAKLLGVTQAAICYRLQQLPAQVKFLKKRKPICFHCWLQKYSGDFTLEELKVLFVFASTTCYSYVRYVSTISHTNGHYYTHRLIKRIRDPEWLRQMQLACDNALLLFEMYEEQRAYQMQQVWDKMEHPVHRCWYYRTEADRAQQRRKNRRNKDKRRKFRREYQKRKNETYKKTRARLNKTYREKNREAIRIRDARRRAKKKQKQLLDKALGVQALQSPREEASGAPAKSGRTSPRASADVLYTSHTAE